MLSPKLNIVDFADLYQDIAMIHKKFLSGELNVTTLIQQHLTHAKRVQSSINCFTELFETKAYAMAKVADQQLLMLQSQKKPLPILFGIPLLLKEEAKWQGSRNTSASLIYQSNIDQTTDIHVDRLLTAGAIPIAKTTTPEFCLLGTTHSTIFGITHNPWAHGFTPGGSSGGTAAALAAGVGVIGTGSDIGGSIRIPAAATGTIGYKPPFGRIPEFNSAAYDYYSHVGPMARTVKDIVLMMSVMAGHHHQEPNSYIQIPDYQTGMDLPLGKIKNPLQAMRIAYSLDLGFFEVAKSVQENTLAFLEKLKSFGANLTKVDLQFRESLCFYGDAHIMMNNGGHLLELAKTHSQQLTDASLQYVEFMKGLKLIDLVRANELALEMAKNYGQLMQDYDIFICPTNRLPADRADGYPKAIKMLVAGEERISMEHDWYMTLPFNLLSRAPVLAIPTGFAQEMINGQIIKIPTGIQVAGRFYDEISVLRAGLLLESVSNWWATGDPSKLPNKGYQGELPML